MRRIWLVAAHEFRTTVRRVGYLVMAFVFPLVMFGIWIMAFLLTRESVVARETERGKAGIVDECGVLAGDPPATVRRYESDAAARAGVSAGEITTFVVLKADYLKNGRVVVASKVKRTLFDEGSTGVPDNIRNYVRDSLLKDVPDAARRDRVKDLFPNPRPETLDASGKKSDEKEFDWRRAVVAFAFFFMMFMSVNMSGQYLIQGLADEKENRVMEMVLTSIRPEELMWGKLLGLGAAGFLQLLIWSVMGVSGVLVVGFAVVLEMKLVLVAAPLFILSYLLMGSLLLGTGSLGTNLREVTQWSMAWSLMGALPFFLLNPILAEPHGAISRGLTFFPLTTAPMLVLRYALEPDALPMWEMAVGYAILIVSTLLAIKAAARIYKVGMLLYGKRPTPRQIVRWLFT